MKLKIRDWNTYESYEFQYIKSIIPDFINHELIITCSANVVSKSDFEKAFGDLIISIDCSDDEISAQIEVPVVSDVEIYK